MTDEILIIPASETDVPGIARVLRANRMDASLFQRGETDLQRHFADFLVAKDASGKLLGCAALHCYSRGLGEVLSVAVLPLVQGRGLGARLVAECIRKARAAGIERLWLATLKPDYFSRHNFRIISRWKLPASVLAAKLAQVFQQPPSRWVPSLRGDQVFMEYDASVQRLDAQQR